MSKDERLSQILQLVSESGDVSVSTLTRELGASPATVRRDLEELAEQQLILRRRGGARAADIAYDLPFNYKTARQAEEKRRIAEHAASLVEPGETIGMNGGTTNVVVAEHLATRTSLQGLRNGEQLVVMTNALNIAHQLVVRTHIRIIASGGTARSLSYELIGPMAVQSFEQVTLDTAILGVNGIHPEVGATAHHEGEAEINAIMAKVAQRVIIVADSSKLRGSALARFVPPESIDLLITDSGAAEDTCARFREAGIEVTVV